MDELTRADDALRRAAASHRPEGDVGAVRARGRAIRNRRLRRRGAVIGGTALLAIAVVAGVLVTRDDSDRDRRVDVVGPSSTLPSTTIEGTTGPTVTSTPSAAPGWRPATAPLALGVLAIDGEGRRVLALDGSTARIVLSIGDLPDGVAAFESVAADTNSATAFVTAVHDEGPPSLWRFDSRVGAASLQLVAEGAAVPAVSHDGSQLAYLAWRDGLGRDVVIRQLAGGTERTVRRPDDGSLGPVAMAWSPDGSQILAALVGVDASFLFRIDVTTGRFDLSTTAVGSAAGSPSFVDDGEIVATSTDGGSLWLPMVATLSDGSTRTLEGLPIASQVAVNPVDGRLLLVTATSDTGALLVSDASGHLQLLLADARAAAWAGLPWGGAATEQAGSFDLDRDGQLDQVTVSGGGAGSELVAKLASGDRVAWRYEGCGGTTLGVAALNDTPIVFHDPCGATVSNARVTAWIDGTWVPVTFPDGDVHGIVWNPHSMAAPFATGYVRCTREGDRDVLVLGETRLVHPDGTNVTVDDLDAVGGDHPEDAFTRQARVTVLALSGSRFEIVRTDEGPLGTGAAPEWASAFDCFGAADPTG